MTDERFDELMRDAEKTYRIPPQPDFDAMWTSIEAAHFDGLRAEPVVELQRHQSRPRFTRWIGIAATLLIGIGVGRASTLIGRDASATPSVGRVASAPAAVSADTTMGRPYQMETSQYLGQTAALLIALPSEMNAGHADQQYASRAGDLLTRTRLLMDSPAADDPAMRDLLEDLELVLAQVVRLQSSGSRIELDLINRALEQRDVIPRLRTAAADISAN